MTESLNNVSKPGTVNNVPTGVSSTANDQAQVTIDHSDRNKDISSCTNPFINPSSSSCFSDSTSGENHVDPDDLTMCSDHSDKNIQVSTMKCQGYKIPIERDFYKNFPFQQLSFYESLIVEKDVLHNVTCHKNDYLLFNEGTVANACCSNLSSHTAL